MSPASPLRSLDEISTRRSSEPNRGARSAWGRYRTLARCDACECQLGRGKRYSTAQYSTVGMIGTYLMVVPVWTGRAPNQRVRGCLYVVGYDAPHRRTCERLATRRRCRAEKWRGPDWRLCCDGGFHGRIVAVAGTLCLSGCAVFEFFVGR